MSIDALSADINGTDVSDPATGDDLRGAPGRHALFAAIQSTRMPMILTDPNRHDNPIVFANRAFVELSGYPVEELVGRNCRFLQGEETSSDSVAQIRHAIETRTRIAIDVVNYRKDGERFVNELYIAPIFGADGTLLYFFGSQVDVTAYTEARLGLQLTLIERERYVLGRIAEGVPLGQVLEDLLRVVEAQHDHGMRTSILFVSEDGRHLRHGAAPSLPVAYNDAIDGIAIGEGQGSCGTVASRGTPVYATDIATDPLWVDFRDLALSHDLRSCWSTPIRDARGGILGTFAIYYDTPRTPTKDEIAAIGFVTQTAALAIERHRNDVALQRGEERLREANEALRVANQRLREANEGLERTVDDRTREVRLFGDIVQSSVTPICAFDVDCRLIAFNQAHSDEFFRIFGYRVQLGEVFPDLFPPDQGAIMRGFMERALTGEAYTVTEEFGDPSVATGVFEVSYSPLRDAEGNVTGAFHHARDISDRLRVEAERDAVSVRLAEQTAARERTWQFTPDLLSVIDLPSGTFERVNPAWASTLGWTGPEIEGRSFEDFVHPDDLASSREAFGDVRRGTPILRFENRYRIKGGGWRWLSWQTFPEGDKLYSSSRDVTQEKDRAEALRLFANIVASDRAPIVAFGPDLRVIGFNPAHDEAFVRVMGLRQKVGDDLVNQFPQEQRAPLRALMERALAGETFSVVEEFGDPDHQTPTWEITYSPLTGEDGTVFGGFHVARDITDRAKAQAELAAAQEALRQSQKMEAVGQLTGGLAHDFNNLLAGISGSLEMMQTRVRQGRAAEIERYMDGAQGAAKRAAALTHRLLAFSRRQTLEPKPTDVDRLVAGMEELIRRTVGPQISVETVAAEGLWSTLVDPNQLENALLNLCINARDAMPDGGRIRVHTDNTRLDDRAARERDLPPGHYVSLCVSDTGSGMPPDVVERAFDPFFTTKPIGVGTGLGLSMIYGFARQSGGQARSTSEVGHGTTVCIYLPRHDVAATADEPEAPCVATAASATGKTVLVVDDEPLVRMLVVDAVEDLGYEALQADDGPQALAILRSDAVVDLLVTDVGLPNGMNGRQVAGAARELRPDLRVLFVTGYAETSVLGPGDLDRSMQVITKPFDMTVLSNRIQGLVGS